jgi:uncharacterized protein
MVYNRDFFTDDECRPLGACSHPDIKAQIMLISFSVSNFRSFGEEQTLSMVASNKITDHPEHLVPIPGTPNSALRAAVLYGANAAGKSNLVRAMAAAQSIIKDPVTGLSTEPFRFNSQSLKKPSSFEFRFLMKDEFFVYGFDVNQEQGIESEWLSVLKNGDDRLIFERDREGKTTVTSEIASLFPGDMTMGILIPTLASLPLKPSQLFLNRADSLPQDSQGTTLRGILRWLTQDLLILLPDHRVFDILERLAADENLRSLTETFLRCVGTGINELAFGTREIDRRSEHSMPRSLGFSRRTNMEGLWDFKPKPGEPGRWIQRRLYAKHTLPDESPATLAFSEESDGTQQLLHLMPVLASDKSGTKVVVIDELDRSLHPLICWEFIRLFTQTAPGAHKQLIVTTHEAHLLNQELLRRDEYWFVEKDEKQQTQLVSLSDFKIRNDLQIEKGYLHGRFGGIPIIGSTAALEKLLNQSNFRDPANAT